MKNNWKFLSNGVTPVSCVLALPALAVSRLWMRRYRKFAGLAYNVNHDGTTRGACHPSDCEFRHRLRRKARTCVRFLSHELGLKRLKALPSRIVCGQLRTAIRSCFGDLDEVGELSVKTCQKLEKSFCRICESKIGPAVEKWKEARFEDVQVEEDHLALFAAAFGRNVDVGWNRGAYPYIPNGHACLGVSRREGGTWIAAPISDECEVISTVSAGKFRIVTLFSEGRSATLFPLHHALYDNLSRKGWLLRGDPTSQQVASLNGGTYISGDYSAATDTFKTAYVREAVEVLISKAVGLTDDEVTCLRMLGQLKIDGQLATKGQPMGSLMSFPLLCLFNKTLVDLSLNDMLREGKITFKEWSGHRCLINGDDLLIRDVSCGGLLSTMVVHGNSIGLRFNREKTMEDAEKAEINSTLFINGIQEKKTNCSALFMGHNEADVIGFADRSCRTLDGFLFAVKRSLPQLRRQVFKFPGRKLDCRRFHALCKDTDIRRALRSVPSKGPDRANQFPVVARPAGYDLSREEEVASVKAVVDRLRERKWVPPAPIKEEIREDCVMSFADAVKMRTPDEKDLVIQCLARTWVEKRMAELAKEDRSPVDIVPYEHVCDKCACKARAFRIICEIRENKRRCGPETDHVPGCLRTAL